MSEGGGVTDQAKSTFSRFGLSEGIAGSLASILASIGISTIDSGVCQYFKGREILFNLYKNKELYKYLPAIVFPRRVTKTYVEKYPELTSPTFFDLSKAKRMQSILVRHGLLVSTQKGGRTVYVYIGGIPEGFIYTNRLEVAQGGASFSVKAYKSLFKNISINPRFGILPLVTSGEYYTNPPINQGGTGFVADIVGIFNFMASTLFGISRSTYFIPAFIESKDYTYEINYNLLGGLKNSTSVENFADTPAIHLQVLNNLIAPSMSDSTNFNPSLSDYFNYATEPFNKAIEGAPIYITHSQGTECIGLQLRGFVGYLDPVADAFKITVPMVNEEVLLSPGLAIGGVIQPPSSWSYDDLVNWAIANGMGLSRNIFDEWVELTLFESDIIGQLVARGFEDLINLVQEHFDPSFETVEKGVDYVVNGIINAYSAGVNAVINFLKSL
ncbi:hypothetical protein WIW90_03785 [Sulfolobaceae archaeon RB850M]